jgi:hypothetical protein
MKGYGWRRGDYPRDPPGNVGGLLCILAAIAVAVEVLVASDWFRCIFGIAAAGGIGVAAILRKGARDANVSVVTEVSGRPERELD